MKFRVSQRSLSLRGPLVDFRRESILNQITFLSEHISHVCKVKVLQTSFIQIPLYAGCETNRTPHQQPPT